MKLTICLVLGMCGLCMSNCAMADGDSQTNSAASDLALLEARDGDLEKKVVLLRKLAQQRPDAKICSSLASRVESDGDTLIRRLAFEQLIKFAQGNVEYKDALSRAIAAASLDADGEIRGMVVIALGRRGSSEGNTKILLAMLQREFLMEPKNRGMKGAVLGSDYVIGECTDRLIEWKANVEAIKAVYEQRDNEDVGYCLAYILSRLGTRQDVDVLIDAVRKSSSPFVRTRAIYHLAEMGERRAVPVLEQALKDDFCRVYKGEKYYPVRDAAKLALESIQAVKSVDGREGTNGVSRQTSSKITQ